MAKVVIITGCSTGVGLSVAVKLAKDTAIQYKVFATMRNLSKKDELVEAAGDALNKSLFIRKLDVTSDSDVETVVSEILAKEKRIDYVINNAGRGCFATLEATTISAAQAIVDVNLMGSIRMCKAVIPTMKQQNSGGIINVSSAAGFATMPFNAMYCASKFGLEGFSESLASELRKFNCYMSIVAPGPIATNFVNNLNSFRSSHELEGQLADAKTEAMAANLHKMMFEGIIKLAQSAEDIADVIIQAMTDDKPKFRYCTSQLVGDLAATKFHDITGENIVELVVNRYLS